MICTMMTTEDRKNFNWELLLSSPWLYMLTSSLNLSVDIKLATGYQQVQTVLPSVIGDTVIWASRYRRGFFSWCNLGFFRCCSARLLFKYYNMINSNKISVQY